MLTRCSDGEYRSVYTLFHQYSILIHSSITDAAQSWQLTVFLYRTTQLWSATYTKAA